MNDQSKPLSIGMVLFPKLTQLDLTGPYEVLSRLPNSTVYLVAQSLDLESPRDECRRGGRVVGGRAGPRVGEQAAVPTSSSEIRVSAFYGYRRGEGGLPCQYIMRLETNAEACDADISETVDWMALAEAAAAARDDDVRCGCRAWTRALFRERASWR